MEKKVMKKKGKRFAVAGVLLTHVVLIVFVLGFTGCDLIKSILGMEEDDPKETSAPVTPPPEDPVHLRLYVGTPDSDSTDDDGTEENPFPKVADALVKIAEAYAVEDEEGAEVKPWPGKNDGKPKSAEIVLLSPVTANTGSEVITIPATADTAYPPLILSAQDPVKPNNDGGYNAGDRTLSVGDSLLTVGTGVTLTLRNITLKGNSSNSSLVTVNKGGNLILADKAVIYGHYTSGVGGGVFVADGGTFTMSGGEIRKNSALSKGGGVYVEVGGTFTMSGGVIWGNYAGAPDGSGDAGGGGGVNVQIELDDKDTIIKTGHFAKTGPSVIYGDEESDPYTSNTAVSGAAVRVGPTDVGVNVQKRESTVKADIDLYWPLELNPNKEAPNNWDMLPEDD